MDPQIYPLRVVSMPLMMTARVPHIVGARPGVRQDGVHVSRLVQFAESTATPTEHVSIGSRNLLKQNSAALVQRKAQVTNCFDIQRSTEFIQCLNVAGMHCITIATVGCTHGTVRVYDSLNKKLTKSLKNTVADILHSSMKKIEVEYVNVQYQLGSDDCELFAIANACEICFGRDPSVVKYTQKDMRKHLGKAFDTLKLMQFPSKLRRVSQQLSQREFINIYCTCRLPNNGRQMIQCAVAKNGTM
ncbi:hypothetical protein EMCRGX_G025663 [Ephydatia muelleri]